MREGEIKMSKVYFKPINSYLETEKINETAEILLDTIVKEADMKLEKFIPLKVHFGEKGNTTFIGPENFEGIYRFFEKNKIDSSYIETNVLYRGERTTSESHKKLAAEHGFTKYPIIIADGDHGENYAEVEINKKNYKTCKIGREFMKYNQMIVAAHFKGHVLAGFGGAIKQLAMGCASRGGKLAQHDNSKLIVKDVKCTKCGSCVKECPADAITLDPTAIINTDKCVGCASCMVACKFGAIRNPWTGINEGNFHERMAEYAYAAAKDKEIIYITFVFNITDNCDCEGHAMKPIAQDLGIAASTDPVALDKACFDLLNEKNSREVFTVGLHTLEHAQEIGLGSMEYEIIEI